MKLKSGGHSLQSQLQFDQWLLSVLSEVSVVDRGQASYSGSFHLTTRGKTLLTLGDWNHGLLAPQISEHAE